MKKNNENEVNVCEMAAREFYATKKRDTYCDIKIRPQDIIVPEELKELCGEFYRMM